MSAGCGGVSQKEVRLSKRRSVRGCHGGLRAGACVEDETHWDASGALGSGRGEREARVSLRWSEQGFTQAFIDDASRSM